MDDDKKTQYDKDLETFYKWKETGDKKHFQDLYDQFGGMIYSASRKAAYGSSIPQSVFKLQAAQQFYNDLDKYNPDSGVKLTTYMYGRIQDKLKRVNATYGNLARIPERSSGGIFQVNIFNNEKAVLRSNLNREPTAQELADSLGWSLKQVESIELELRKDLSLNAELEDMNTKDQYIEADSALLDALYFDMTPEEKLIHDYANGLHGKRKISKPSGEMDVKGIAKELRWPESKVIKIRNKLRSRIVKYTRG